MNDAINAAEKNLEQQWQPIETAPVGVFIDVLLKSTDNPLYTRRVINVSKRPTGRWNSLELHHHTEYPAYWMRIPAAPEQGGKDDGI